MDRIKVTNGFAAETLQRNFTLTARWEIVCCEKEGYQNYIERCNSGSDGLVYLLSRLTGECYLKRGKVDRNCLHNIYHFADYTILTQRYNSSNWRTPQMYTTFYEVIATDGSERNYVSVNAEKNIILAD